MKKEILNRLNEAYENTVNSAIAITCCNYIDTVEGISEEDFTEDIYQWYDEALTKFGFPKKYKVVKTCKITGIVITEKTFSDKNEAYNFANQVSQLGYTKSKEAFALYESPKYYIQIV